MSTGDGNAVPNSTTSSAPVGVGRWLGRYELLHEIATGGMATVYLARARGLANFERVVAIKVCHPHLRGEEEFASMFLDEARLAARIHHPNVVGTLDVGEGDSLYLVMEYIEGDRLSGLIKAASKRSQFVPVPVALRIMIDTLSGLHAAHELKDHQGAALNIVHRDVSPQNVLVSVDGVTRITDFGIAKAEARLTVTREGQVKGKMSYMAPEQLASGQVDRRADVYAAGVVLWETLTGRRLFRADSDAETLNMVLHGVVPAPSTLATGVPVALDLVVRKALERDPDKRFASAADFADALENLEEIKVATTRAVAVYVNELLADTISKRRELVRKLGEGGPLPALDHGEQSLVRATSTGTANPFQSMSGRATIPLLPNARNRGGEAPDGAIEIDPEPPSRRAVWYAGAAAVALLLLVVGGLALRHDDPPPAASLAHPAAPVVAAPVAPSEPPAPVAPVAQTATPPAETAPPPSDETQASAHGRRGRNASRGGRAPRPGAQPETPPEHVAPAPTQPQPGSGEFRPSSI